MDSFSNPEAPLPADGVSSPPRSTPSKPYPPSPLLKDRLAQLRQSATCDDALLSLKQIVREMQPSAVPRFLTHLQSETGSSPRKPAYSHHAISLYVSLAREHKDKLVPQIPRVMRNLMLHLKSPGVGTSIVGSPGGGGLDSSVHGACVQVVLELARIPTKDEQAKAQLLQDICTPLIGALSKSESGTLHGVPTESFGAAHCLKALVDAEDIWKRALDALSDDVCSETSEALQVEGAAIFLQLACSLARSNISVCQHYASDLLRAAGRALQWRAASWQQRFAAAKLYTEMLSRADLDVALSLEKSALEVLESCRTSDPSPYVCAQIVDAIRVLEARSNRPLLRGPRTPDASPPRRTPHASPPLESSPSSPPVNALKPTVSAESPKLAPKRSKPNEKRTATLASVDWPSEDPNAVFGGSPIYEAQGLSDESPLLLLKARGVTSQGSGKMMQWTEERKSGEFAGLGVLAKTNDWRSHAKLMQSAEWPTLASGSPVYDPEDLDLTLEGLDKCPEESTGAFLPAIQLDRTPQKRLLETAQEEQPGSDTEQLASPKATPVVALARTPLIALEAAARSECGPGGNVDGDSIPLSSLNPLNRLSELPEQPSNPDATLVVAQTPVVAFEAAVKSESSPGPGETTDGDHNPASLLKQLDLSTHHLPEQPASPKATAGRAQPPGSLDAAAVVERESLSEPGEPFEVNHTPSSSPNALELSTIGVPDQPANPEATPVVEPVNGTESAVKTEPRGSIDQDKTPPTSVKPSALSTNGTPEQPANHGATPVVMQSAVIELEAALESEKLSESRGSSSEDRTAESLPKSWDLSIRHSLEQPVNPEAKPVSPLAQTPVTAPELAAASISAPEETFDEEKTPPSSPKPPDQLPETTQPEALFVSKIPRAPSVRDNPDPSAGERSLSSGQEKEKEPLTIDTAGVPSSPSAQGSPPRRSPSRIPTPTSTPRPKASVVGSHIPPPPSLTRFQSPMSARQEKEKIASPRKQSFEERLSKVAGGKASAWASSEKGKEAKNAKLSRRKSSLGPSDFLSTSPRQMLRRLAAESPVKDSPTTTPRSVLAVRGPRGIPPSTFLAEGSTDFTPPDTPVGESGLNGASENGLVVDMDVEEQVSPGEKDKQRRWSVNGGKAAGRYSLDTDSESETEESGERERGRNGVKERQDEQSGERTGEGLSIEATGDVSSLQEAPAQQDGERLQADETGPDDGIASESKLSANSETNQSSNSGSKTSAEGSSVPLDNEWCVRENPIAGRPSTSSAWEASESTFDESTMRRMSEGEVSSPGAWEERHVAGGDMMNGKNLGESEKRALGTAAQKEEMDASEEAGYQTKAAFGATKEKDEGGRGVFTPEGVRASEGGVDEDKVLGRGETVIGSAAELERILSGRARRGTESSDVREEETKPPEKEGPKSGQKMDVEGRPEEASKGTSSEEEHRVANQEAPRGTSEGSACSEAADSHEIRSCDAAPISQRKPKKRVSFSGHDEIQLIALNPQTRVFERGAGQLGVSMRKWYKLAEKGVKTTVIAVASLELGVVLYVVSRGVWEAYCAPALSVPLPT